MYIGTSHKDGHVKMREQTGYFSVVLVTRNNAPAESVRATQSIQKLKIIDAISQINTSTLWIMS